MTIVSCHVCGVEMDDLDAHQWHDIDCAAFGLPYGLRECTCASGDLVCEEHCPICPKAQGGPS